MNIDDIVRTKSKQKFLTEDKVKYLGRPDDESFRDYVGKILYISRVRGNVRGHEGNTIAYELSEEIGNSPVAISEEQYLEMICPRPCEDNDEEKRPNGFEF